MPLQIRRGTAAERDALSSPLVIGELLYTTDTGRLYIGDGTSFGEPDLQGNPGQGGKGLTITGFTTEDAQDATANLLLTGTHSHLFYFYDDTANTLSSTLVLDNYTGNISLDGSLNMTGNLDIGGTLTIGGDLQAAAFKGSLFADDSTLLVDAVSGSIPYSVLSGAPTALSDFTNDVGFIRVSDIADGTVTIDVNNTGDLVGSVFADDSTLLVDSNSGLIVGPINSPNIVGPLTGDVVGNVQGNVQGNVVGNLTGNVVGDLIGNVTGSLVGDIKGSVFGDNSSMIVDGITGDISARDVSLLDGDLTVSNGNVFLNNATLTINSLATLRSLDVAGTYGSGISVNNNLQLYESAVLTSSDSNANLILGSSNSDYGVNIGDGGFTEGRLKVIMTDGSEPLFFNNGVLFASSHDNPQSHVINYYRTRGTYASPTTVQVGDTITDWRFWAHTSFLPFNNGRRTAARIRVYCDGEPTTQGVPTAISFATADGVVIDRQIVMKLTKNQVTEVKALAALETDTISLQSAISNGSIRIYENNIEGENSNEDLVLRPSGTGTVDFDIPTQGTVGAAGAANALPATPSTYFKIKVGGTEYVVPAYAVS